jgi:integrase
MAGYPKKIKDGTWKHDFRVGDENSPRYRKVFQSKSGALSFEREMKQKWDKGEIKEREAYDNAKLFELCQIWYDLVGLKLKDGERRKNKIQATSKSLKNPLGSMLTPLMYSQYRARELKRGMSKKTLNNELGYLKAVYNSLIELKALSYANPLLAVKDFIIDETQLAYLDQEQIPELFEKFTTFSKNPHVGIIAEICLATGARWGEAEGLTRELVKDNRVWLGNERSRKSSKNRIVPIKNALYQRIVTHFDKHGEFTGSLGAFRRALEKTSIALPKGQSSHVLRHSFASHFMMRGGNILTLKRALGHSDIKMTMRYAHLAPDHLQEAVELNPSDLINPF